MSSKQHSKEGQKLSKTIRVRRITDFPELFEPSDAKRKAQRGGLSFTKSQVTTHFLSKEQEHRFFERLRMLKNHADRYLLRSVFEDLKNWTAAKHLGTRGYLVTAEGKPASYNYLAAQLQMATEDLKKAIPILEQIGLIEWAMLNGSPDAAGRSRTQTATAGTKRNALNNGKRKSNTNNKSKRKRKATIGLSASGSQQQTDNGNSESQAQGTSRTTTSPTTAPPMPTEPKGSDAGGHKVIPFTGPPAAADYSRAGLAYGLRVYMALGYRHNTESPEAQREITSFASKHDEVLRLLAGHSPPVIDGVLARGLREAPKIAKRKSARNRAAVWNSLMDKLAAAKQQRDGTTAM